jgi:hypothetical protein
MIAVMAMNKARRIMEIKNIHIKVSIRIVIVIVIVGLLQRAFLQRSKLIELHDRISKPL